MASAKITTLAFYRWMINHDDDLFKYLYLPEGVDKTVLVNNILMQSAPFEVVYSDPEIMQSLIGTWADANAERWQQWVDAWADANEFNPLENFDRTEHEVIQNSGTDLNGNTQTRNLAGSDNRTANLSEAETRNLTDLNTKDLTTLDTKDLTTLDTKNFADNETKNLTTERKVSAYDSSTYSPKEQETQTGTDNISHTGTDTIKNTGTDTVKNTGTDTMAHTGTDTVLTTGTDNHATTDTGTVTDAGSFTHGHKIERDARFHGNIGVTSLSSLLADWNTVVEDWDIYAVITNQFLTEFCILVY